MAGCPFGENCHFLHFVPGGYKVVSQMMNLAPVPASKTPAMPQPIQNGSAPSAVKTKLCKKFNSVEGCKFNDKCHFAHGERELSRPATHIPSHEDPRAVGARGCFLGRCHHREKCGVNSKQIYRQTEAKLSIRDHETDPGLRNIELEGTFEQLKQASMMVRELIISIGAGSRNRK
ncbi:KH domain-containing protein / zinc finger family protein [Perilla frutescens var. hirtella]|nr:KH domain-containing protein / zinc finger family protein [Perilla frutescens var. hirtella]KAH6785781.1 hypothetical protein C2S51_038236 [Perilla frutescens var. frutescens]